MRGLGALPLPAAIAVFAGLIVAGIYLDFHGGGFWVLLGFVAVVAVLAGLFLLEYSRRPIALRPPVANSPSPIPPEVVDDTPFDDPVIEADQIASGEVLPGVVEAPSEPSSAPEAGAPEGLKPVPPS